jgi:site-specific recombinase XerD
MSSAKASIRFTVQQYIELISGSRQRNTAVTYAKALRSFLAMLEEQNLDPDISPTNILTEDTVADFASYLKNLSPATERLYLQAVLGYYKFLSAEKLSDINLPRLDLLLKHRTRKVGIRLPQFPVEEIRKVLDFAEASLLSEQSQKEPNIKLRAMRDRAFLISLADTGLRVHEACALRRGDIDWNEGRALIIGKGDKQAVIRFSTRSLTALKDYLVLRRELDGKSGKPLSSLPLFARHDKGSGKKVKPITTTTGRNIVDFRVRQALGDLEGKNITPHSFRHFFVTTVLRGSGNLKLAQELARHTNIQVTQRYAHLTDDELDKGYHEIFEDNSRG